MLWALALLGVLPAAFLFGDDTADSDSEAEADDMSTAPVADNADDGSDGLSFLLDASNIALRDSPLNLSDEDDASGEDDVVLPNDPDVAAPPGPSGSDTDEVASITDPDSAAVAGPDGADTDDVLDANMDDENVTGDSSGETVNYILDDEGDSLVLPDAREQGGTDATLTVEDGVASLETDGTLNVVQGGAGDDTIGGGDDAAIVFGNAGNDALYAGDGSAILDGGEGDDTLVAGQDAHASYYLNGGAGSDTFVMEFDSAAGMPTIEIADFDPLVDIISIAVDAVTAASGPVDLTVTQTEDGLSSTIEINEIVVATVTGVANLDPNIIALTGV